MNKDYDNVIRIATSLDFHDDTDPKMCIRDSKGGITSRILSIFFKDRNEFISTMLVELSLIHI